MPKILFYFIIIFSVVGLLRNNIHCPCSVACGMAHSMAIVDRTNISDRLDQVIPPK